METYCDPQHPLYTCKHSSKAFSLSLSLSLPLSLSVSLSMQNILVDSRQIQCERGVKGDLVFAANMMLGSKDVPAAFLAACLFKLCHHSVVQ